MTYNVNMEYAWSDEELEIAKKKIGAGYKINRYKGLGEMDPETAMDVYNACEYMFTTYPEIKGTLTNLTIGNLEDGVMLEAY